MPIPMLLPTDRQHRRLLSRCWPGLVLMVLATVAPGADAGWPAHEILTPGWATFGVVVPRGVATAGITVQGLATQLDIKTRWDDGSIRFAVVTVSVPSAGTYTCDVGTPATGRFVATCPLASVTLSIAATPYTTFSPPAICVATLPSGMSADRWLDGPLVQEWRCSVEPIDSQQQAQGFLSVIYDIRCYVDGGRRVDVTVENTRDSAGATAFTYDVAASVDGVTTFQRTGVVHHYLTRWRSIVADSIAESSITTDVAPAVAAGALPPYLDSIDTTEFVLGGPTFDILGRGGLTADYMGLGGGRPELAPYPDWTARLLVHGGASRRAYVLANGDLAGSQPIHIREPDGSLVSIDARPQFWLDARGQQYVPLSDQPHGDLSAAALGAITFDTSHQPSLAYVPYLLTGDRYDADELAFWANAELLLSHPFYERNDAQGLLAVGQVRGFAWSLRNLVDAAAYLPDATSCKPLLVDKLRANLQWADGYADGTATNQTWSVPPQTALGSCFENRTTNVASPWNTLAFVIPWENNYLAWALDHANRQGFPGGDHLRDRISAFQLALFSSAPAYPQAYAAPYVLGVGTLNPDFTVAPFTSLTQVFAASFTDASTGVQQSAPSFAGYWGEDARLSLMMAHANAPAAASNALQYLMQQPGMPAYIDSASGWAIATLDPWLASGPSQATGGTGTGTATAGTGTAAGPSAGITAGTAGVVPTQGGGTSSGCGVGSLGVMGLLGTLAWSRWGTRRRNSHRRPLLAFWPRDD